MQLKLVWAMRELIASHNWKEEEEEEFSSSGMARSRTSDYVIKM